MIKHGLKIWSTDRQWFKQAVDLFKNGKIDFAELYIVPDSFKLNDLEILRQMPFSIHAPHYTHGFNLFEITNEWLAMFQGQVIKAADFLRSDFIVVHPGIWDNKDKFKENSAKITDKRVLIETMAKVGFVGQGGNRMDEGVLCFGYSEDQLDFIHRECGFGICLDFVHSAASAFSQGIPYKGFIVSLLNRLNPTYFHISGGYEKEKEDKHLDVFDGDLDNGWIKGLLEKRAKEKDLYLVFETPKIGGTLDNDVKNINYFKDLTSC